MTVATCCCPSHCPSVIPTRTSLLRSVQQALASLWARLLAASLSETSLLSELDARALRDIGWCCEPPPRGEPHADVQQLRDFW